MMRFLDAGVELEKENASVLANTYLDLVDGIDDPVAVSSHIYNTASAKRVRGYEFMRLSEIDSACPREWIIGHLSSTRHNVTVRFSNMVLMDQGSATHWWVQNSPIYFQNRRIGYWKCICCESRYFGAPPAADYVCPSCGAPSKAYFYDEYIFRLTDPFRVVGKIDMILRVGNVYRLLEIKTYDGKSTVPRPQDVLQTVGYNYFSQFDPMFPIEIDRSVSYLSYIGKTFSFDKPILTFPIRPTEVMVNAVRDKLSVFTHGTLTGELAPVLSECSGKSFSSGRSKNCPVVMTCQRHHARNSMQFGMGI